MKRVAWLILLSFVLWPAAARADGPGSHVVTSAAKVQGGVSGRLVQAGIADLAYLDNPADNIFKLQGDHGPIHRLSYAAAGALGGYAQEGYFEFGAPIGPGQANIWLGTYYSSVAAASAELADVTSTLQADGYASRACGATPGQCAAYQIGWTDSNGQKHTLLYGIEQQSNAIGEFGYDGYAADMAVNAGKASQQFGDMAAAAHLSLAAAAAGTSQPAATAQPAPPLQGTHPLLVAGGDTGMVLSKGGEVRFDQGETTVLRLRQSALLFVEFWGLNLQQSAISATFAISRSGQTVRTVPIVLVHAGLFAYFATSTAVTFRDASLVGPLTARFTITAGSLSVSKDLTFQLLPAAKKCKKAGKHPHQKCK
jgi:hypothetical protein